MARISTYGIDAKPALGDKLIGTDIGAVTGITTKNYSLQEIVNLFNRGNSLAVADQSVFLFQDNLSEGRKTGTLSFASGGGVGEEFSAITSILLSKTAAGNKNVAQYLQLFLDKGIVLAEAGNINNFGQYTVEAIEDYPADNNFYEVTLSLVASNGVLAIDAYYVFGEFTNPAISGNTNYYTTTASFETSTGIISFTGDGGQPEYYVDLDGRYAYSTDLSNYLLNTTDTFTGTLRVIGEVEAVEFIGELTGNASTVTKLQTARAIAGVNFDGSTSISLDNVNITNGAGYTTNTGTSDLVIGTTSTTAKAGDTTTITGTQAQNILDNNAKISFDNTSSTRLASTSGTNTGDQDLSGLQLKSEKDSASGYAGLDGSGKINPSQLPALAITDTFVVASQSAMLALTAQVGDVAIRTDLSKTFILKTDGSTVLANWQELQTPTDLVTTVFGRSGVVTAQNNDYTFAQINKSTSSLTDLTTRNFSDLQNKPTTVLGYGITDSYTKTEVNTLDAQNVKLTVNQSIDGEKTFIDSFKITTDSSFLAKTSDVSSHVVAMIDSSSNSDSGGLAIKTGDNNDDESALYILNYQDDTLFNIKAASGNLQSAGSASFASSISATDGLFSGELKSEDRVTVKGTSPFYKFEDSNGNRLGFIQHNGTDLVVNADTGQFKVNQSATFSSSVSATEGTFNKTASNPTVSVFSTANLKLKNPSNPSNGDLTSIAFPSSSTDNYGMTLSGERTSGATEPSLVIRSHNNSDIGNEVFRINSLGAATFASSVSAGSSTNVTNSTIDITGYSSTTKGHIGQFSDALYLSSNYFYNGSQNNEDNTRGQASIIVSSGSGTNSFIGFNLSDSGSTSPTTKLTIDSSGAATFASSVSATDGNFSGDIGINGASTSGFPLSLQSNNGAQGMRIIGRSDNLGYIQFFNANGTTLNSSINGSTNGLQFVGAATFASSVTVNGNAYFGTTGIPNGTSVYGSAFTNESVDRTVLWMASSFSGNTTLQLFYNPNGLVGTIRTNGSSTTYNTTSDYRLKEDLKDFKGLEMISNIPVYDYKWKVDESRSYGVMAHELQEVLPNAVSGEKDAEEMQGVDYSKVVPLLIKSIQELAAKVELLENK